MTDVIELLTGVLAEHYDMDLTPAGAECECGQVIGSRFGDLEAQHRAHLAAVLAPVVARAQAEATNAERRKRKHCGCGFCCASRPVGTEVGSAHRVCSSRRASDLDPTNEGGAS